jgi:hypothetical protein
MIPVVNGPFRHPSETRRLLSPSGLGNARRGGPLAPLAASWICVAVFAGEEKGPETLVRVMFCVLLVSKMFLVWFVLFGVGVG